MITMHPGTFIQEVYLENMPVEELAARTGLPLNEVTSIIAGERPVTASIAIKLEYVLGRSAKSWLAMQNDHDLAKARAALEAE